MHPSVQYVCDLCTQDTPASADLRITWAGRHYRVDLCDKHAQQANRTLAPYTNARTASRRARSGAPAAGGYSPKQVREWARRKRIPVPDKGRLPKNVVERYLRETSS